MKKRKNKSPLGLIIALLCLALLCVIAVIVFKHYEYGVSTQYYNSLRSCLPESGVRA